MAARVFKYEIPDDGSSFVASVHGSCRPGGGLTEVLHIGPDPTGRICMWAEVDDEKPTEDVRVHVVGSGLNLPAHRGNYLGTFVSGRFVWHVYSQHLRRVGDCRCG